MNHPPPPPHGMSYPSSFYPDRPSDPRERDRDAMRDRELRERERQREYYHQQQQQQYAPEGRRYPRDAREEQMMHEREREHVRAVEREREREYFARGRQEGERRDSQRQGERERERFAPAGGPSAGMGGGMYPPPPPAPQTASGTNSRAGSARPHPSSIHPANYPAAQPPVPPMGSMPPPPGTLPDRHAKDHREREHRTDREERSHHPPPPPDARLITRDRERDRDPRDSRDLRERERPPPPPAVAGGRAPSVVPRPSPALRPAPPNGAPISPRAAPPLAVPLSPGRGSSAPVAPVPSVQAIQNAIQKGTEAPLHALAQANEQTWLLIGAVSEQLNDTERANAAYEHALRHNPTSVSALTQVAGMARVKEDFHKAVDYYQRVLNISQENGEVWGSLGHCYLMMDDLQKAYTAYQQALYRLPNPKDPKLWYGIGILYDRYGSLEHAEEAFSSVLRMEPNFDKANEVYFRLGIIYKTQQKFASSLECFRYILNNPPKPLTEVDIWFQVGHVHEQQKDYNAAKDAYERVLKDNPNHAKVLQQLGWLYHQPSASFSNQDTAILYLTKSLEADPADAQSWYLLGRAFMEGQKYNKAYEAYQQAVYRDGKNPTFWCSIGVLYYQINQYRDALDAYSRAIRLNPFISEVWFNLGSLYESCNNQVNDAIDAYARAHDLDPANNLIKNRLNMLRNAERDGVSLSDPPPPQDVHPTAYAQTVANRAFPGSQAVAGAPFEPAPPGPPEEVQPVVNGRDLAAPPLTAPQASTGPESAFRNGGGPPPLQITPDVRGPARPAPTFAPMDMDQRDRSAAPRPAVSVSGRSVAEDEERTERTPAPVHEYQGQRGTPYRPGSSSSAVRQEEWQRERAERAVSTYHPSPRVSPTVSRTAPYASRATLDARLDTSPRSIRRSPAYDYAGRVREDRPDPNARYAETAYEAERRRVDEAKRRDWQEQDRAREDDASISGSAPSLRVEEPKNNRAPSPARPASSHSRPGSSRRKRKAVKAPVVEPKTEVEEPKRPVSPPTPAVKPASPQRARIMDEDYDEGAADALMGLAGYRGIGQGKESTYAPVNAPPAPVVRLDPQQISNNLMSSAPSGTKRATASSPTRENTESREKKARYESPPRAVSNSESREKRARYDSPPKTTSNPSHSPARSIPSAISIPSRTVTTMIEVLNPTRVTPTGNSPMTASEMVSPSQRVDEPSPRRELAASPTRPRSGILGDKPVDKDTEVQPPVARSVDPPSKSPVVTSPHPAMNAAAIPQDASPAKNTSALPAVTAKSPPAPVVSKTAPEEEKGDSQERLDEKPDVRETDKAESVESPEVSKANGELDGKSDDKPKSANNDREAMDTSL